MKKKAHYNNNSIFRLKLPKYYMHSPLTTNENAPQRWLYAPWVLTILCDSIKKISLEAGTLQYNRDLYPPSLCTWFFLTITMTIINITLQFPVKNTKNTKNQTQSPTAAPMSLAAPRGYHSYTVSFALTVSSRRLPKKQWRELCSTDLLLKHDYNSPVRGHVMTCFLLD